jgi:hypothetical protein
MVSLGLRIKKRPSISVKNAFVGRFFPLLLRWRFSVSSNIPTLYSALFTLSSGHRLG